MVHDACVVTAYELSLDDISCYAVYGVAKDLSVAIDGVVFACEVFVVDMYMVSMWLGLCGSEFSAEVFTVHPYSELIGIVCVVA